MAFFSSNTCIPYLFCIFFLYPLKCSPAKNKALKMAFPILILFVNLILHQDSFMSYFCLPFSYTQTSTHKHKHTHTHTHTQTHTRTHTDTHTHIHTRAHKHTHTHTRARMHASTSTWINRLTFRGWSFLTSDIRLEQILRGKKMGMEIFGRKLRGAKFSTLSHLRGIEYFGNDEF